MIGVPCMHPSNAKDPIAGTSFEGDPHPLHVGDVVAVFGLDGTGGFWLEGRATIIACCPQPHLYRVRFQDEKRCRVRFVGTDFWHLNRATDPQIEDFFPTDSPA